MSNLNDPIPVSEDGHVPFYVTAGLMAGYDDDIDWDAWKDEMKDEAMRAEGLM